MIIDLRLGFRRAVSFGFGPAGVHGASVYSVHVSGGFAWFGGFGWPGVGVLLVFDQQLQRLSRLSQNPDRAGPPGPNRVDIAARAQDVGDPVYRRQKPDGIPGVGFSHNGFQAVFGVEAKHILGDAGSFGTFRGQRRVGLQDRCGQDPGEARPRHHAEKVAERMIKGLLRDFAGLPGPHPTGEHPIPQPGQPIAQIQRIRDQRPSCHDAGAVQRAEFCGAILRHLRSALTPQAHARWINGWYSSLPESR
jgi:hypothetical protein